MSDASKGRGRGRGRRIGAHTLAGAVIQDQPSASPSPAPAASRASSVAGSVADAVADAPDTADDAPGPSSPRKKAPAASAPQRRASVKRVASVGVGSTRAPSVGVGMSRTPSLGGGAAPAAGPTARDRPVGGLLGSTSEFRPGAAAAAAAGAGGAKPKFKPNMRRARRVDDSEDEDIKEEDGDSFRNRRGPRAPRTRQELEMTASGPMAQGPGGPPRAWGARPPAGASGAAVMAASRAGTLNRMLDDDEDASDLEVDDDPLDGDGAVRFKAVDLNDIGAEAAGGADGDEAMTPLTLPRDPKVLRTKIRRLQERKVERLKKEARNKAKAEGLVKDEPGDESLPSSATGTPAPAADGLESKEGSIALVSVDEDKEAKDLKDLEEEEKKEIILSEAFDLSPEARGELYMFQFPRKFPSFVPAPSSSSSAAAAAATAADIKPDPDAAPGARKPVPPAWGRFGSRSEKAARWSAHEGRVGELCVHRSGKVTLKLAGDLRYEVRLVSSLPCFSVFPSRGAG
ncbi:hypothetical protein JCM3770_005697 [Rhodotorula araucariae]